MFSADRSLTLEEHRQCLLELAHRNVRWGQRLVYRRLRLEGCSINHKRVQRIWWEEGLQRMPNRSLGDK